MQNQPTKFQKQNKNVKLIQNKLKEFTTKQPKLLLNFWPKKKKNSFKKFVKKQRNIQQKELSMSEINLHKQQQQQHNTILDSEKRKFRISSNRYNRALRVLNEFELRISLLLYANATHKHS